ncbi:DUF2189 domain-containing protein [Roseovarius aestuarii]|uniref:Cytochrome c oxidase subunit I n=1 Tax=Roseovarius aestuarii TaxID=475083 RepID=A0A1X7BSL8_9RHOB|nr:DUF2189 domain-containing protein [Roseovarius aestuarii]SMC12608.1 hypothetical protein ROA7745_02436 [Roseovarius aestuarii]
MVKTIGNPLTWAADAVFGTGRTVGAVAEALGSEETTPPPTRTITETDIRDALRKGVDDFKTFRSDVMFLVAIYPIIGICLVVVSSDLALLPLLFPLAAGFALLGPVAGIGLYEMSRRREAGEEVGWGAGLQALRAHIVGPVMTLGVYLLAMFVLWIMAAMMIYGFTLGPEPPASVGAFAIDVLTTSAGWMMIMIGMGVGFVFAAIVLVISVISFPMLIDRRAGIPVAVATSVKVARQNPVTIAKWGLIVAVLMALGSLPFFLGLIVVLPILSHATWHLYRAAVPRVTER